MGSLTAKCSGCGAQFQSEDEKKPGYISSELLDKSDKDDEQDKGNKNKKIICKRCYRIKNYNEILQVTLHEKKFINILKDISNKDALVIYVMDIFDVEGSWLEQIPKYLSSKNMYVVINKIDLLPRDTKYQKIHMWIKQELNKKGLNPNKIFILSALKQWEIDDLANNIIRAKEKDVYIVGSTNVGKSTLINKLVPKLTDSYHQKLFDLPDITTSFYSGTTVETLKIKVNNNITIYDTPGIIKEDRLIESFCPKCLQVVIPKKRINPKIYQLNCQQTLFIGGIIRVDYIDGEKQPFICYFSNELDIHRTKLQNADNLYKTHFKELLSPPCLDCSVEFNLNQIIDIDIKENEEIDLVISGLGWIAFKGTESKIRVHAPDFVHITTRDILI